MLVIAPHPDDETFGCGGLIKLKRDAGVPVRVILLTDGEAVGSAPGEARETIVAARTTEFTQACRSLGVPSTDLRYLHFPDGALPHPDDPGYEQVVQAICTEIAAFMPGEVFCTHEQDARQDHVAAAEIARAALLRHPHPCDLFYFPIWMWYHASSGLPKRLVSHRAWRLDITSVLPAKQQAMDAYLNAPRRTSAGHPFCGRLPWSLLRNFRRSYEVYFTASDF